MGVNYSIATALASLTSVQVSYTLPRSQARRKNETDLQIARVARFRGATLVGAVTESVVSGNRIVRSFTYATSAQTVARYFTSQYEALSHKDAQKAFLDESSRTNLTSYPQLKEFIGREYLSSPDDYAVALDMFGVYATSKLTFELGTSTLKIGAYGNNEPYGTLSCDNLRVYGTEASVTGTSNLHLHSRGNAVIGYAYNTVEKGANVVVRSDRDVSVAANEQGTTGGTVTFQVGEIPVTSSGVEGGLVRINDVIFPRVGEAYGTLRALNAFDSHDSTSLHTNWTPTNMFTSATISGASSTLSPDDVVGGMIIRNSGASGDTLPMAPLLYNAATMRGFTKQTPSTVNFGTAVTPQRRPLFKSLYPYNRNVVMLNQSTELLDKMYVANAVETDFLANKVQDAVFSFGSSKTRVLASTLDVDGNAYFAGTTDVALAEWNEGFGTGLANGFVIKYDVTGEVCWVCYVWGVVCRGIALNDTTGDVVVCGDTFATRHSATITESRIGLQDAFVATIDPSGFLEKITHFGQSGRSSSFASAFFRNDTRETFLAGYTDGFDGATNSKIGVRDALFAVVGVGHALIYALYVGVTSRVTEATSIAWCLDCAAIGGTTNGVLDNSNYVGTVPGTRTEAFAALIVNRHDSLTGTVHYFYAGAMQLGDEQSSTETRGLGVGLNENYVFLVGATNSAQLRDSPSPPLVPSMATRDGFVAKGYIARTKGVKTLTSPVVPVDVRFVAQFFLGNPGTLASQYSVRNVGDITRAYTATPLYDESVIVGGFFYDADTRETTRDSPSPVPAKYLFTKRFNIYGEEIHEEKYTGDFVDDVVSAAIDNDHRNYVIAGLTSTSAAIAVRYCPPTLSERIYTAGLCYTTPNDATIVNNGNPAYYYSRLGRQFGKDGIQVITTAVDADPSGGGVCVVGTANGLPTNFVNRTGDRSYTGAGDFQPFVSKFDRYDSPRWIRFLDSNPTYFAPRRTCVDSQGNVYAVDTMKVYKFDKDGVLLWSVAPFGTLATTRIDDVDVAFFGVYVVGRNALSSADQQPTSLAHLDASNGTRTWIVNQSQLETFGGGAYDGTVHATVRVDRANGSVLVSTSGETFTAQVFKYNSVGAFVWQQALPVNTPSSGYLSIVRRVMAGADSSVYVAGAFTKATSNDPTQPSVGFVRKLSGLDGSEIFTSSDLFAYGSVARTANTIAMDVCMLPSSDGVERLFVAVNHYETVTAAQFSCLSSSVISTVEADTVFFTNHFRSVVNGIAGGDYIGGIYPNVLSDFSVNVLGSCCVEASSGNVIITAQYASAGIPFSNTIAAPAPADSEPLGTTIPVGGFQRYKNTGVTPAHPASALLTCSNSKGEAVWKRVHRTILDGGISVLYGIAVDPMGNIYTAGTSTTDLESAVDSPVESVANVFVAYGDDPKNYYANIFVSKYDRDGNCIWTKFVQTPQLDAHLAPPNNMLACDAYSNVYLCGFTATAFEGMDPIQGQYDTFVMKFSSAGTLKGIQSIGENPIGETTPRGIAVNREYGSWNTHSPEVTPSTYFNTYTPYVFVTGTQYDVSTFEAYVARYAAYQINTGNDGTTYDSSHDVEFGAHDKFNKFGDHTGGFGIDLISNYDIPGNSSTAIVLVALNLFGPWSSVSSLFGHNDGAVQALDFDLTFGALQQFGETDTDVAIYGACATTEGFFVVGSSKDLGDGAQPVRALIVNYNFLVSVLQYNVFGTAPSSFNSVAANSTKEIYVAGASDVAQFAPVDTNAGGIFAKFAIDETWNSSIDEFVDNEAPSRTLTLRVVNKTGNRYTLSSSEHNCVAHGSLAVTNGNAGVFLLCFETAFRYFIVRIC